MLETGTTTPAFFDAVGRRAIDSVVDEQGNIYRLKEAHKDTDGNIRVIFEPELTTC